MALLWRLKNSLSDKAQMVKCTLYGEDSNFMPMVKWLKKGIPSSRGHSPCRAHIVGCRTQDAIGPYLSFCSGAFLFRGKSAQPYSKTQPIAAIILIRILIIIFFWGGGGNNFLGTLTPSVLSPQKWRQRGLLGKRELNRGRIPLLWRPSRPNVSTDLH